ncbi:MAG: DNA alkylation repair protein [Bacteroidales bacterium]|jgi:3-methyladenine DNA glycosylase AlkD|nr:DNA alkylation repair protein [Bacteroidales bacterium]
MNPLHQQIRNLLLKKSDEKIARGAQRFFKNEINALGVKAKDVDDIAKNFYKENLKDQPKQAIFDLAEMLFQSKFLEENGIACQFVIISKKCYEKNDIFVFERWIDKYVSNWAICDSFCNHAVGEIVEKFPGHIEILKKWSLSENLWLRRASAVSLIIPSRKGLFLKEILEISSNLLIDKEDMVQKGYGWLLKAASMTETMAKGDGKTKKKNFDTILNFILNNKSVMPRTSLRYVIEKMPEDVRRLAMDKKNMVEK